MDRKLIIVAPLPVIFGLLFCGCEFGLRNTSSGLEEIDPLVSYSPASVDIMPLTEFSASDGQQEASQLKVYVSMLDAFDCQIKAPSKFRFELFEHQQRSATPKGKRLAKWSDIDLTDAVTNNSYWQDYLRGYKFILDFEPQHDRAYVLQVTCHCSDGRRLIGDIVLKYP